MPEKEKEKSQIIPHPLQLPPVKQHNRLEVNNFSAHHFVHVDDVPTGSAVFFAMKQGNLIPLVLNGSSRAVCKMALEELVSGASDPADIGAGGPRRLRITVY